MKIEGKITAYLSVEQSVAVLDANPTAALDALTFSRFDLTSCGSYFKVGVASIVVELEDRSELSAAAIAELRRALSTVQAEAQRKVMAIESKINDLLALPAPAAADAPSRAVPPTGSSDHGTFVVDF